MIRVAAITVAVLGARATGGILCSVERRSLIAELVRFRSDVLGTFGALVMPGKGVLVTVERPWVPTDQSGKAWPFGLDRESCIPAGTYHLERAESPKFGRQMWYIVGSGVTLRESPGNPVEWRSGCMFHAANRPSELMGCIAPGELYVPGGSFVGNSTRAMIELIGWLESVADPQLRIRSAV